MSRHMAPVVVIYHRHMRTPPSPYMPGFAALNVAAEVDADPMSDKWNLHV